MTTYCKKQKEGHDAFCNKEKDHTDRHTYKSGYWWANGQPKLSFKEAREEKIRNMK